MSKAIPLSAGSSRRDGKHDGRRKGHEPGVLMMPINSSEYSSTDLSETAVPIHERLQKTTGLEPPFSFPA